jgi:transposase-like protein
MFLLLIYVKLHKEMLPSKEQENLDVVELKRVIGHSKFHCSRCLLQFPVFHGGSCFCLKN